MAHRYISDEALTIIQSAHQSTMKQLGPDVSQEELFLNGFLYGMGYGLHLILPSDAVTMTLEAFKGEPPADPGSTTTTS